MLSQAIYLQPRHNDHPVTEYYTATFTHKKIICILIAD
ncbi:hypothetical protein ECARS42123_1039 [Escherichia coli ARS4.2123]|nr:hypothetical protein ECARS42123_1039 [Escherichia coli ARS4.2123]